MLAADIAVLSCASSFAAYKPAFILHHRTASCSGYTGQSQKQLCSTVMRAYKVVQHRPVRAWAEGTGGSMSLVCMLPLVPQTSPGQLDKG